MFLDGSGQGTRARQGWSTTFRRKRFLSPTVTSGESLEILKVNRWQNKPIKASHDDKILLLDNNNNRGIL